MNLIILLLICFVSADYWEIRESFIKNEENLAIGEKIQLTLKEKVVNEILMAAKRVEIEDGFKNPANFSPAIHFFKAKNNILNSSVFKFIKKMPKGGALHIHDTAITSKDYVIKNITYRDNLYACLENENIKLIFANSSIGDCWVPLKNLRENSTNIKEFDRWLKSKLTLETENPEQLYSDVNVVWREFRNIFQVQMPMICYKDVFIDYFYQALKEFYEDNVNYMEIRGTLPEVYDLNGSVYNSIEVMGMLKDTADLFLKDYPDFLGIKYIYAPSRQVNNETMEEYLQTFKIMKMKYPDILVGFDLVGQEDLGKPLKDFINTLQEHSDVKFYFHAGETNWNGMSTDTNLIDAILLNTTRIGHGFALFKHPSVLKLIKQKGIAIEVCPLSHQILNLIKDLRNHPASYLFAEDYPVVISSDDPALWGASGLSFDFYEAFMGIARSTADLKLLKQLALNSLLYSSLDYEEKRDVLLKFENKWNNFIDDVYINGL